MAGVNKMNLDLFGGETEVVLHPTMKQRAQYRKATELEILSGHICKFCKYLNRNIKGIKFYYKKCSWIGDSASVSTDIALSGTCPKFALDPKSKEG